MSKELTIYSVEETQKIIWNYFLKKGLSEYGIAGLMGNIEAESSYSSINLQNNGNTKLKLTDKEYTEQVDSGKYKKFVKDAYGYGLCQWTYHTRKQALLDYAKSVNKSIGDLNMQLDYLWNELQGYKVVLSVLKSAKSIQEASDRVLFDFENPADKSDKVKKLRASNGQKMYDKFAKGSTSSSTTTSSSSNKKTNAGLLEYSIQQVGLPYWYGTFGQISSKSLYEQKKKQYPNYYTATDFASQYGKRVHDCVGLIKGYIWTNNGKLTYNASQDKSASGMYLASNVKGSINSFPKKLGQLVYKGSSPSGITHVGVYDGNGYVYEAKGHAYGVVKTKFDSSWTYWSQCPYCEDTDEKVSNTTTVKPTTSTSTTTKKSNEVIAKEVIAGKWGNGATRKTKLTNAGYNYSDIQKIVDKLVKGNTSTTTSTSVTYTTYTVKKGDNLWKIAEKLLGNGLRNTEIKKLNGLKSNVIIAGQVLKIPKK